MSLDRETVKKLLGMKRERFESYSFPKPTFATHSVTTRAGYDAIPLRMTIDMEVVGRPVSLSLDGCHAELHSVYYTGFVFDLYELMRTVSVKPAIYLLSRGKELIPQERYYLQTWPFFYEAEILAEGTIPLQLAKAGLYPALVEIFPFQVEKVLSDIGIKIRSLSSLPSEFRRKVVSTFKLAQERKVFPILKWAPPPPWLQDYLHSYNETICGVFGLHYPKIREKARSLWEYVEWK